MAKRRNKRRGRKASEKKNVEIGENDENDENDKNDKKNGKKKKGLPTWAKYGLIAGGSAVAGAWALHSFGPKSAPPEPAQPVLNPGGGGGGGPGAVPFFNPFGGASVVNMVGAGALPAPPPPPKPTPPPEPPRFNWEEWAEEE